MSWPKFWTKPNTWQAFLLSPLSYLVCFIAKQRLKKFIKNPPLKQTTTKIIVVGNIVVGGTGKTPFILWLAQKLAQQNISYGIVSRGYGGKSDSYPILVNANSNPLQVGDEPILFAKNLACPIAIAPKRLQAIELLNKNYTLDVIIADDGLQHYAMPRDIEIIIFDGQRGIGNGKCMPAGPLRESYSRLKQAKFVISNGNCIDDKINNIVTTKIHVMYLEPIIFKRVNDPTITLPLSSFKQQDVDAIAGIGNPERFYNTLKKLNINIKTKSFADHKKYTLADFNWQDNTKPLLMTEKDAVKCYYFAPDNWWYLEVSPTCDEKLFQQIRGLCTS